jgi:signal transduction histidine kinase/DNA-binding response OmpR family regulator
MMESSQLSQANRPGDQYTLTGKSEMGQLMRSVNWAETPLGPVSGWSQSLRTSVSICLNSRFPILIWWGPKLIMLYNDAYRPILGSTKHPKALGQPGRECWPEIWHIIGPMLEGVITSGQATWSEDQLLLLDRNGFLEECYFTFSYSPIQEENSIGGAFTAVTETTGRVISERRMRILAELSTNFNSADTEEQICSLAIQTLAENRQDLPFAALYLLNKEDRGIRLVEQTGLAQAAPSTPAFFEQAAEGKKTDGFWSFPKALDCNEYTPDDGLNQALELAPDAPGIQPTARMKVLTIGSPDSPLGFLVAGLSPYRPLDEDYLSFLSLAAGQIASALSTVRALEEERKRTQALAELDRAKTEFFSNVSHEFRTPITLMLGPVQDALVESAGSLSETNRARFEMVHRNGLRMLKLVNTLLDFSRIEAGRFKATFQPVDLATLTTGLASTFRSTIEHANLRLEVNCPPLPEPVYVDPEMWEKIVLNLLSNAFKYTFEGQITISQEWKGQHVELRVADTGTGIAPDQIPLLFERFHRIEGARARSVEGSGIGLALVQELVRLHGGQVSVTSELGHGSTFYVSLPTGFTHLPPEQIHPSAATTPSQLGAMPFVEEAKRWLPGIKIPDTDIEPFVQDQGILGSSNDQPFLKYSGPAHILLADDNADMRDYLGRLLSSRWTVEAVSNGREALQAIQHRKPDLVLSDVMMPGIDGFGLLRRLREEVNTRDLPIILVSARAGEEARMEGLERGADDYLVKPFSAREILARVESRLELSHMRKELQQKITGILESLTDAFLALDHDWRVVYANQPAARLTAAGEMLEDGADLRPYLQKLFAEENWRQVEQAMRERQTVAFEQYQPETQAWYKIRAYPYETGLAIYAADVTIEKTVVETRRQVEQQRRLLENREKERQDIARDIHDGPIQTLVGAIFNAQFAKEAVQDSVARIEFEQIGLSLKGAVRELRDVINELRPPTLIRFGLAKAIQVHIADLSEKHPEFKVHLELEKDDNTLPETTRLALYRVFQEGMNNIIRHSGASQIWIRFNLTQGLATFELQDDGKGFLLPDPSDLMRRGHYGLAGMKERVDAIQGELQIHSEPGQGTTLRVSAPLTVDEQ